MSCERGGGWLGGEGGVYGRVGAEEVGVAGEGVVGMAVDEEADAGDVGEGGVEGADDGLEGEGFDERCRRGGWRRRSR